LIAPSYAVIVSLPFAADAALFFIDAIIFHFSIAVDFRDAAAYAARITPMAATKSAADYCRYLILMLPLFLRR